MKAKSRSNKNIQKDIANCLKKGLPLAGLISSLVTAAGCDWIRPKVVGRMAPNANTPPKTREEVLVGDIAAEPEEPNDENQQDKSACEPLAGSMGAPEPPKDETKTPPLAGAPPRKQTNPPVPPLAGKPAPVEKK